MRKLDRSFLIFMKHKRWQRMWRSIFTGWGLVMIVALIAGALFSKQLLLTPITAVNMTDIVSNQFKMTNAYFAGTDSKGDPFKLHAQTGRQEYEKPDIVFLEQVSGTMVRLAKGEKITDNIFADSGEYSKKDKTVRLLGDVRVNSSNGDKVRTNELVIKL